jgi:hypothetical protein
VQTFTEVEINISREKEFIILIIKNILERVSGFFTQPSFLQLVPSIHEPGQKSWVEGRC